MFKTILGVLLLGSQAAFAALPPLSQSGKEIQAIVNSQESYRLLGGADRIEKVSRVEKGYVIATRHKEVKVDVNYVKTDRIGPAEFTLYFHTPVELD